MKPKEYGKLDYLVNFKKISFYEKEIVLQCQSITISIC